jgi:hypothetical protein
MGRATAAACGLLLTFMLMPTESHAQAITAQVEITHLLTSTGLSNCDFNRNGIWYSATQAQAHLEQKLALLSKGNEMQSAEELIVRVATKSAFTNLPYRMRCAGYETVSVSDWLAEELRRYRQCASAANRCASRLPRDARDPALSRSAPDVNRRVEPLCDCERP